MVGTLKREVKRQLQAYVTVDAALKKGLTLQRAIEAAVALKGVGEDARASIVGSQRKLPWLQRILAAEKDAELIIHYDCGHGTKAHFVKGTGGGWCSDSRCT